jgi:hypothetical protein
LEAFEEFVQASALQTCIRIHAEWKLPETSTTYEIAYDAGAWKDGGRLQFRATSNAHESNGEVTLNFIMRRQAGDSVICCAQLEESVMFEGINWAHLR